MKLIYILPVVFLTFFISCSSDDDNDTTSLNEIENLIKVKDITNDTHTIEIYTQNGKFYTGYNNISIRIKDNVEKKYIESATISWSPMMQMETMKHSCPKSEVSKVSDKNTVYNGFIIYQMTGMNNTGWSLKITYIIDNQEYEAEDTIMVMQSDKQNVTTIMGSDDVKYILALLEPSTPKIAVNDIIIGLYKMENIMKFPVVENYTIALDPRMPSMGNHSSPNNQDLTYSIKEQIYNGKLSLTMSGYWMLNLKLINDKGLVLKGEDITDSNTQSSLYLEIEF
ncbi:hypothetical protein [Aquimarina muelleri]|uniref:YtkA-like domain-containing protein n=1 Tax=Aquimarina muelleri TaxID=279356 RepID=A0A918JW35_9FLAO|nr:hypothetical protein [Aquimarina muelleri]MCX2762292.1 hypothetical protein [Aquimarina muelleri]GGX17803.1 hypothetical protein GCM10007384_19010 [Aquimarina muelleri]